MRRAVALTAHERARSQRAQLSRLKRRLECPVATLPFIITPELGLEDLERLATEAGRKL